ncbi:MAG: DUF4397 domain-containing protein [Acidimicrobiia bacterium]
MTRRRALLAFFAVVAGLTPVLTSPAAVAAPTTSAVSVVQALKGLSVDLYLDGSLAVPAFQPRSVAGPLNLSAADHRIQAFLPVANPPARSPIGPSALIDSVIAVPAGLDLSLVIRPARLENATGLPQLSTFVNDTSFVGAGRSRFVVRHVANLGKIDIKSNDVSIGTDIAAGGHAETVVPNGTTSLLVNAAGTETAVVGPANVNVPAERSVIAYVIANPDGTNPELITQSIALERTGNITTATGHLVNAVLDQSLNITIDGARTFADLAPKSVTNIGELEYGEHVVLVTGAGGGGVLATRTVTAAAGTSLSIVAHVASDGSVGIAVFNDEIEALNARVARVSVRNVSRLGVLDVNLDGQALVTNVGAGSAKSTTLAPFANASATARTAGTATVVEGPTPVSGAFGELTTIYLASSRNNPGSNELFVAGQVLDRGYRIVAGGGEVSSFNTLPLDGSVTTGTAVDAVSTPTGKGFWTVSGDGIVKASGDAAKIGPTTALQLVAPIVDLAATPTGKGLWLVAGDGGVFSYGDAVFYGSTGGLRLNQPIVAMESTPTGKGYWLVASDGGVFSFGDALFYGSTGSLKLNKPIVDMAAAPGGLGYWLVATDGGIFSFGNADFWGSTGSIALNQPIVDFVPTPTGRGYWLVAADGGLFNFGNAPFYGSAVGLTPSTTVAIIA